MFKRYFYSPGYVQVNKLLLQGTQPRQSSALLFSSPSSEEPSLFALNVIISCNRSRPTSEFSPLGSGLVLCLWREINCNIRSSGEATRYIQRRVLGRLWKYKVQIISKMKKSSSSASAQILLSSQTFHHYWSSKLAFS